MILRVRKKKRFILAMTGILAGILVFEGIVHILDQMYVGYDDNEWYRILWHNFYEDEGKIDNICLGSSHVYHDIDPMILDQLNGQYNFNLASHSLPLNGSYYLLKEAARTNELSHVYLELCYGCNYSDDCLLGYSLNWRNTDYMRPSLNKIAYGLAIGGPEQYINICLPFSRYRACLGDWDQIKYNVEAKNREEYGMYLFDQPYVDDNGKRIYGKKGNYKSTRQFNSWDKYLKCQILSGYSIGEKNREYLCRIIRFCREREIPITLFVSPIYDLQLISTKDYDDYVSAIKAFAAEYEVPFYDFNLAKEEYFLIQDDKYFSDAQHLNQYGAEKFTPFFYQVVSGEEEDNKKYFCDSYEERLRESKPAVYGIYAEPLNDGDKCTTLWVASNRDTEMEYRITLKPDGKKRRQIQDFQENKKFEIPVEEHGICTIAARVKEMPTKMQTMSIPY